MAKLTKTERERVTVVYKWTLRISTKGSGQIISRWLEELFMHLVVITLARYTVETDMDKEYFITKMVQFLSKANLNMAIS